MAVTPGRNGALNIRLPIVFKNSGAREGAVRSLGLLIREPHKEGIFIRWMGLQRTGDTYDSPWVWESNAAPFCVPAGEVAKMVLFTDDSGVDGGPPSPLTGWAPQVATYELVLLAWTAEDSSTPASSWESKWEFKEGDVAKLKANLSAGTETWVSSSPFAPESAKLSPAQCNHLLKDGRFPRA